MERIFKSVAVGVALALALVWCLPNPLMAQSEPQGIGLGKATGTISVASGGNWGSTNVAADGGACGGRLSSYSLKSTVIGVPYGAPFVVWITTDQGLAADGDSVMVVVESQPDNYTGAPTAARAWTYLGCGISTGDSTDYPMVFHFNADYDSLDQPITGAVSIEDGGDYYYNKNSLGRVRISLNGPQGDSLADAAGRWKYVVKW